MAEVTVEEQLHLELEDIKVSELREDCYRFRERMSAALSLITCYRLLTASPQSELIVLSLHPTNSETPEPGCSSI